MDFRFRAIDNKAPLPAAAASSSSRSSDHLLSDDSLNAELMKQRIREEIMIREIASRRMLEAEIRRELLMEQELAMRRAAGRKEGLSLDEQLAVKLLDQKMNHIAEPSVPGSRSSLLSLPAFPLPKPQTEEPKPAVDDEMNNLIVLPRPDPAKFEGKRKAEGEAAAAEGDNNQNQTAKKLAKEEFVCNMCKVKATSEISFNAHLKGKKHMAKEGRGLQTHEEPSQGKDEEEKKAGHHHVNKRLKFWCNICQVGVPCKAIMVTHNNGKKHKACLLKLSQQKEDNPL